jgi:hypothetical protein
MRYEIMKRLPLIFIALACLLAASMTGAASLPDGKILRDWVQAMKTSSRGPFKNIRWFCSDGTIQPPEEYACREHGGGVQHGQWTDRVKTLRDNGYYIANIFADIQPEIFLENPGHLEILRQMILEQFLIEADQGWIFRNARYYRGALQAEDEARGGRDLLLALVKDSDLRARRFMVLREAVQFLPHGRRGAPISEMRQLALAIAEKDPNFETLRIKIHVKPELSDAENVRAYAKLRGLAELSDEYECLAVAIEKVYQPQDVAAEVLSLAAEIKNTDSASAIRQDAGLLTDRHEIAVRFSAACRLLAALRDGISAAGRPENMLASIDAGLLLEDELFRHGNDLLEKLPQASRRRRLAWLKDCIDGLYGTGLISQRQRQALQQSMARVMAAKPYLIDYRTELEYAARLPEWADRTLRFHFGDAVGHLEVLEPLTRRFIHDRLRGSILLFYSSVLDSLIADANRQLGIQNYVFGQKAASGLRGLNAGLARGVLIVPGKDVSPASLDRHGIYVLPATTENLPPVAGIITTGEGNILSHVQLLARNLGIPNVAVDNRLLPQISSRNGQRVVLAVSPRGIVQLADDGPQWEAIFAGEKQPQNVLIHPDLDKLDLTNRSFIRLQSLRAQDSGKVSGPKAANLGELKYHYQQAVADGLVIPFGVFRALLDRSLEPGGPSALSWMQAQYAFIRSLAGTPLKQQKEIRRFLQRMQDWLVHTDLGDEFRNNLQSEMTKIFGADGTYGVFVRSDTNVEDLPGFTGAGLNLTVPNVVGFENILTAIGRVWASPFTERAYRWRQAYMETPEDLYVSILLLKSIPAEKSGVMVTADVDSGQPGWLTIAVNEGVGGAVSGQNAEELRVNLEDGRVRLMAEATEPYQRVLLPEGGITKIPVSGSDTVLSRQEINILIEFAKSLPHAFPGLQDAQGRSAPADIEFGFYRNRLMLFQIRPFLESLQARKSLLLNSLDLELNDRHAIAVDLDEIPGE